MMCFMSLSIVLISGIEMSNNNSKIYFITDADAKDAHLENEVKNGLKAKGLELIAILTGKCPGRRKRDATGENIFWLFGSSLLYPCIFDLKTFTDSYLNDLALLKPVNCC